MKKWHMVVLAALVVGLGTAVFAYGLPFGDVGPPFAGPPGFRGGPGGLGPQFGPLTGYLNLSKEQIDKLQALRDSLYNETKDLRDELAQKQIEMREILTDPKTSDETTLAKQKEISALRQQLFDRMAQMPAEVRKILTPDQMEKLAHAPIGPARVGFGPR